jgi:uncharacterized membrane protein
MVNVRKTVTIQRSPQEVYDFWRDLENLPRFMQHVESVEVIEDGRSHWVAKGPAGKKIEWDAQIVDDVPGALISWRSLPGADVRNAGVVRFRKAGEHRTEVVVDLTYDAPGGALGAVIAKLLGDQPSQHLGDDLRRFKQVLETGEVVSSDGFFKGAGKGAVKPRSAQAPRESAAEARS